MFISLRVLQNLQNVLCLYFYNTPEYESPYLLRFLVFK